MTRDEAEERARRRQAEDPERERYRFVAREAAGGEWEVTRVELPDALRRGKLTETIEAKPKPSPADDPRTGHEQRIPGVQGGL
jgi:hypothetical protein